MKSFTVSLFVSVWLIVGALADFRLDQFLVERPFSVQVSTRGITDGSYEVTDINMTVWKSDNLLEAMLFVDGEAGFATMQPKMAIQEDGSYVVQLANEYGQVTDKELFSFRLEQKHRSVQAFGSLNKDRGWFQVIIGSTGSFLVNVHLENENGGELWTITGYKDVPDALRYQKPWFKRFGSVIIAAVIIIGLRYYKYRKSVARIPPQQHIAAQRAAAIRAMAEATKNK